MFWEATLATEAPYRALGALVRRANLCTKEADGRVWRGRLDSRSPLKGAVLCAFGTMSLETPRCRPLPEARRLFSYTWTA
jgi:hypothetical protein